MGKFDGILIVSDLDGTLLNCEKEISAENRRAIAYFEAEGGHFTYISGRVARCLAPILQMLTPPIPVGCNNGMVYDPNAGEWVDFTAMSSEVFSMVEDVLEKCPDAGVVVMGKRHVYFSKRDPIGDRFREIVGLSERYDEIKDIKEPFCKVLFTYPEEKFSDLKAVVDGHSLAQNYEIVRSDPEYYEVMPRGCNKGRALARIAAHLGVSPKRTIAVGDNENDITMFRSARLGIAVANAAPSAKEAADMVLEVSNQQHAIAEIIARIADGRIVI